MAEYTEADIQNALADIANGIPATTAAKKHGVPRTTLYGRISGSQHHKTAHFNMQRLSLVQEDHLATWILRQFQASLVKLLSTARERKLLTFRATPHPKRTFTEDERC